MHVVLYQPEIPQNVGNIGRTCVALGATLWLVRPLGFELTEKRIRRAGLDYWRHLRVETVDSWEQLPERFRTSAWRLTKHGSREYTQAQFAAEDVFLFGSESSGLPPAIRDREDGRALRVPMDPKVRSLNLSTCVGIVLYEARRQVTLSVSGELS